MKRIWLPLVAGLSLLACAHADSNANGSGTADTAQAQPTQEEAAAGLREHHRHHHNGGVAMFIAMSLDTLGVDDAKRPQVEKLQGDLHQCMAPTHELEKSLLGTLADGVAAGAIDTAKVDATITQMGTAATGVHDCSVMALNQLHAILSPAERAALVDKVQAHYDVWRQVNQEAEPGGQEKGGRLAELATELNLTPDQVTQMSAAIKTRSAGAPAFERAKAEAHLKAFETAFTQDTFDAKTITTNANGHFATHGSRRMAHFYEAIAPLLTPDQRTTLAEHLRQHANPPAPVASN